MHYSLDQYLVVLVTHRRSPLTIKAIRHDLTRFIQWWEGTHHRKFNPALLVEGDVYDWLVTRQQQDGAAPASINRGLVALQGYCAWAYTQGMLTENPAAGIADIPTPPPTPRSLPPDAIDALLRATRNEHDPARRWRDEAILALLIFAGLRVQEVCDLQLRDLDLAGGTVTVRRGKAGRSRRVPLHKDAQHLLQRYLERLRCPDGLAWHW